MPKEPTEENNVAIDVVPGYDNFPEAYKPTEIQGKNRLTFPSPFEEYPGEVSVVKLMSAPDYHEFWSMARDGQPDSDDRHWSQWVWESRFHLAKNWALKNVETSDITKDGMLLPDQRIAIWFATITQLIVANATSLPNWQGLSRDI
jgi:hypothetical protein